MRMETEVTLLGSEAKEQAEETLLVQTGWLSVQKGCWQEHTEKRETQGSCEEFESVVGQKEMQLRGQWT